MARAFPSERLVILINKTKINSMKKSLTLIIVALMGFSAQAKVYRVNNNPGTGAQFTSFQTAHDSCHTGDTIYVEGTTISYGTVNISKKINVIGPGYFLAQNPQTQVNPSSALFTQINCNTGSTGTYLTGLDIQFLLLNAGVTNIVIKRNHIGCPSCSGSSSNGPFYLSSNNSNVLIIQNYIVGAQSGGFAPLTIAAGCSNVTVSNNYIEGTGGGYPVINVDVAANAIVTNNIFKGTTNAPTAINNSSVNNNFFLSPGSAALSGTGSSYHNNFSIANQFDTITGGNINHNHIGVNMTNVIIGSGSSDGMYKLKAGSPAIGAGFNSEDCGIFGGLDPYILSGIPTVPSIYFFAAPTSGSGTLPVHVKIKSNK